MSPPSRLSRRDVADLLRRCVRENDDGHGLPDVCAAVEGRDLTTLVERAVDHGVSGPVYRRLRRCTDVEDSALEALRLRQAQHAGIHMRALADLELVSAVLGAANVPTLVVKGPVLAELVYPDATLRTYWDLDLVVPRPLFARAVAALQSAGARMQDRNWTLLRRERRGQVHLGLPRGTTLDLHWHVVNRDGERTSLAVDMDGLFERAVTVDLAGRRVRTFDRVDTVLHLCLHAGLDGARRLCALEDIGRSVDALRPDWGEVVTRAREWRAAALVGVVLRRARGVLAADVPAQVLDQLLPRPLQRGFAAAVDRLWPLERSDGGRGLPELLTSIRRDSAGASAAALRARVRAHRLSTTAAREMPGALSDVHVPSGDEAARAAYFAEVSGR